MQYIHAWLTAMYAYLIDVGAPLVTGELVLIGETIVPDGNTAETDLVRPNYTTYADAAIAAFVPAVDGTGVPYLAVPPKVFSPTAETNLPQYIYGAGILDAAGNLVVVSMFAQPIQLSFAGQQLHVTGKIYMDPLIASVIEAYTE
jgi:hypothetical protein